MVSIDFPSGSGFASIDGYGTGSVQDPQACEGREGTVWAWFDVISARIGASALADVVVKRGAGGEELTIGRAFQLM